MSTSDDLDQFAHAYYMNGQVATIDVEELAQLHSVPRLIEAIAGRGPVLEMGFGTGLITRELLGCDIALEVVEGSPVLADEAVRRHAGLPVHVAMFESFEPTQRYGAVLALHVLEHVTDPVALLRHMRGWLADDGALVVVVPNAESLHRRIAVQMGLHANLDDLGAADHLVGHQRVYDLASLTHDLDQAGYDVEFDFGYLLKTVPNSMLLDYPPDMVLALNEISTEIPTRDLANIGVRAVPRVERPMSPSPAGAGQLDVTTGGDQRDQPSTESALLTALILSDGDVAATEASVLSSAAFADEVVVLERAEVDWTDTATTTAAIAAVSTDWILVLSAGEQLGVGNVERARGLLQQSDTDAQAIYVGLSTEVRLHRANESALDAIGAPSANVWREVSIAPPSPPTFDDAPAATVIVPTFNRPVLLRRCLEGLCVQTTRDFDVIVVNDGGVDVSSVVGDFSDVLDVSLVTRPHNGGAAQAANTGLARARGDYINFQADDDTIKPHHLALLLAAMADARADSSSISVVFGPAFLVQESEDGEELSRDLVYNGGHPERQLLAANFIVGGAALFDRVIAQEIGGMDTKFEVLEDWDFWIRMSERAALRYVDTPTAEYRIRLGEFNMTTQARPKFYTYLLRLYEAHPVAAESPVAAQREQQIRWHEAGYKDVYAWEHSVAIIGDGDLTNLATCLQSIAAALHGESFQLIIHELRSPQAEELLADLALDATVCFHASYDEALVQRRIRRQAGGRCITVLQSSQRLTSDNLPETTGEDPESGSSLVTLQSCP